MNLSNYSNRELVKELTSRKDFLGCVLHYNRPLTSPIQDASQAMIVLSMQMDNSKALSLLKAAVRAMERAATESTSGPNDKRMTPSEPKQDPHSNTQKPLKFVPIRPELS